MLKEETTRVALIGIIVDSDNIGDVAIDNLNGLLHSYSQYIIGRMGVPYKKKNISIISVAIDAPNDIISALSGKLGAIDGVSTKTVYSKA